MRIQQQQSTTGTPPGSTWYTGGGVTTTTTPSEQSSATAGTRYVSPHVQWPDTVAYREAIQNPQTSLTPPELRYGTVHQDRRGMPVAYTGRFAVVFRITGTDGRAWALRCFTIPPQAETIQRADRYRLIASHVSELGNSFVPFKYFEHGVRIGRDWFPILAMRWASGETLGKFTDRNLHNPEALRTLAATLSTLLKKLEDAGIAHGDWQHDNLLVSEDGKHVTLVDYDGMFVPELAGMMAEEMGHPNYQHPGRTNTHFGPDMDRFPCLVMQSALLGLSHDPTLWNRFSDGESLLFKKVDLQNPSTSPVFRALKEVAETYKDEVLADSLARLEDACHHAPAETMEPAIAASEMTPATTGTSEWDALPSVATITTIPSTNGRVEETVTTVPGSARWWLDGPAITLPDPAQVTQTTVSPALPITTNGKWFSGQQTPTVYGGAGQAQMYAAPVDAFAFIERVESAETLTAERKHFTASRVGVAVLAVFTVLFIASLFGRGGSFPFYLFFWVFNLGSLGYANWPRKKIYDELEAEIAKMEKLMNERREKIAAKRFATAGNSTGTSPAAFGTLEEYIADRLSKTSVHQLSQVTAIPVAIIPKIRKEGVTTAYHIRGRSAIAGVTSQELIALHAWVHELEMTYANEYRQWGIVNRPPHQSAEIARLEQEAAEFERERDRLLREKAQFPDVAFMNVYMKRLLGLPQSSTSTPSPSP